MIPFEVPRVGERLAGKYIVQRILGIGGMGVVVAAEHQLLGEAVAVKLLKPEVLKSPGLVERFLREARAALRIKSEHVVRIMDVDVLETGAPYLVMELLEGSDLSAHIAARGALPIDEAVGYLLQACDALDEAHSLGIVHRDLKPANLFLARRRDQHIVKLLDFGISKIIAEGGSMTAGASILGSPSYMSPEQMRSSRDVDARSDIWALGVILYELLAGKDPFKGESLAEICTAVLYSEPEPIERRRPDLPPMLAHVVGRCMRKERNERFSSVGELIAALSPFAPRWAANVTGRHRPPLPSFPQAGFQPTPVPGAAAQTPPGAYAIEATVVERSPLDAARAGRNPPLGREPSFPGPTMAGATLPSSVLASPRRGSRWLVAAGVASVLAVGAAFGLWRTLRTVDSEETRVDSAATATASAAHAGESPIEASPVKPEPASDATEDQPEHEPEDAPAPSVASAAPSAKPSATSSSPRPQAGSPRPRPAPAVKQAPDDDIGF
jgi:serine/threonine-protein kinase